MRQTEPLTLLDLQRLACSTPAQRSIAECGGRLAALVAAAPGIRTYCLAPSAHPPGHLPPPANLRPPVHLHPKHLTLPVHLHPSADLQPTVCLSVHLLQHQCACRASVGASLCMAGHAQACPTRLTHHRCRGALSARNQTLAAAHWVVAWERGMAQAGHASPHFFLQMLSQPGCVEGSFGSLAGRECATGDSSPSSAWGEKVGAPALCCQGHHLCCSCDAKGQSVVHTLLTHKLPAAAGLCLWRTVLGAKGGAAANKQAVHALLTQKMLLAADARGSLPVAEVHPWDL